VTRYDTGWTDVEVVSEVRSDNTKVMKLVFVEILVVLSLKCNEGLHAPSRLPQPSLNILNPFIRIYTPPYLDTCTPYYTSVKGYKYSHR
jgi:hypothetical protein